MQVSSAPGGTAPRKLIFISALEQKTLRPSHEGHGGRAHGRVGEGPEEAPLHDAGRVGEALVRPHAPDAAARRGLVDAGHAEGQVAVWGHLHAGSHEGEEYGDGPHGRRETDG